MKELKKPAPMVHKPTYDFNEVIAYVEKNHGIKVRDYREYYKWPKYVVPYYLDYWHWLIDHAFYEVHDGCTRYFDLEYILGNEDTPAWVREITQMIKDDFKDELDEEGGLTVYISW